MSKHFHLAFQGGGAKGLAYVGAYRAIQSYQEQSNQPVPIKSIMGSSAGGIIALAISTGIPEYELQRICYKMNKIPLTDRIQRNKINSTVTAQDNYGNNLNFDGLINILKRILHQYGVISQKDLTNLIEILKKQRVFYELQDTLHKWLAANVPALAEILTLEANEIIVLKKHLVRAD